MNNDNIINSFPTHNFSRIWSYLIIHSLTQKGIEQFYVSPGMRNSPLLFAIESHPKAKSLIGMDERAQGFRALGYAKGAQVPAVLVCTSGSALGHYLPAVLEASKSNIPLIVLSADRPFSLSASDANQTIEQKKIYGQHVRKSLELETPSPQVSPRELCALISSTVEFSFGVTKGPIHINAPFDEPLDHTSDDALWGEAKEKYKKQAMSEISQALPKMQRLECMSCLSQDSLEQISQVIKSTSSPLVVIGQLDSKKERQAAIDFVKEINIPVVLDVTSGVKFNFSLDDSISPAFDHPEVYEAYIKNPPDVIFHFGARMSAKYYELFLKAMPEIPTFLFKSTPQNHDPALRFNFYAHCDLAQTFKALTPHFTHSPKEKNIQWDSFVQQKSALIDNAPLAYPSLSKSIVETLSSQFQLYLGNSTVIRSFDSYASKKFTSPLTTYSHRGTSGIEGFMAAALGLSEASSQPVCLVLGDVSTYHDLNSFELLAQAKAPVLVVIINNGGGGIFSLLPIAQEKLIRKQLFTPHQINFTQIAKAFGLEAQRIEDIKQWREQWPLAQKKVQELSSPLVLEVMINDHLNTEIYQQLRTIKL